jgi:CHAD domain-containing protein
MTIDVQQPERGIYFWMNQVVAEADKARDGFKADPVHDLRVAIRRCRSIGEGFLPLDPHPYWKKMRKASKPVFSALGELRDVHVLMEWIDKISASDDPVHVRMLAYCQTREQELKSIAAAQLGKFDSNQWAQWAAALQERSLKIPLGGRVFQLMTLERWDDAHRLHLIAMRNRSKVAMHELRIGIKKFRYIVENFLPDLHEKWKKDLKRLQDLLGEIHDLDVLWETAKANHAMVSLEERKRWLEAIRSERGKRVAEYKALMIGKSSLWRTWRSELPDGQQLRDSTLELFETWAFFRDPDLSHTHRVMDISLLVFDTLSPKPIQIAEFESVALRDLLTIAAMTHNVAQGQSKKRVLWLLEKLTPPPGWRPNHLKVVGLAARYQSGPLPSDDQKEYASLKRFAKRVVDLLGGLLRLAEAFDFDHRGNILQVQPQMKDGYLLIEAVGYQERSAMAEKIAKARHLLESICKIPIIVRSIPTEPAKRNRQLRLSQ